ncbi:hypothetical protein [Anaeromyxobacter sp. Fw109-5]|uniref:hypothetical protein n=1 Tax=Anaeromyxobacter sp. (strain Fw109-5) TaxID=404589 RepID=UPI0011811E67|nr:hypothetical protein [Anaeromyxobacter sp. Fw109-5]
MTSLAETSRGTRSARVVSVLGGTGLQLLRRLDTLLAAALLAFGLRVIPDKWLCGEVTCRAPRDAVMMALFTITVALAIAFVFWRVTRRWWERVLVLVAAAYVSNQLPVWLRRHGSWNITRERGSRCEVTYGMRQDEVRRRCGAPTYWCEGPKHLEPLNQWNPVAPSRVLVQGRCLRRSLDHLRLRGRSRQRQGHLPGSPGEDAASRLRVLGTVRRARRWKRALTWLRLGKLKDLVGGKA